MTSRKKSRKRRPIRHKVLEANGMEILKKKGSIVDAGPSLFLVPSMSSDDYHEMRYLKGIWSCDCSYFCSGHIICKHICAVRSTIMMQDAAKLAMQKTGVGVPQIRCPGCGMADFHESTAYKACRGDVPVYRCDTIWCGKRFVWRPGFIKKRYSDVIITDALVDAASGHPPARICERMAKNGVNVTERTIRRWIDEYSTLIDGMASTLRYTVGGRWSIDEKYLKTHPNGSTKKHWLVAIIDELTGMILAFDITDTKPGYDATKLFEQAIAKTGRVPDVMVSDGLGAYKKAFENVIKIRNPSAVHVADVGINGKHVHNNKHERKNGEFGDCLYRGRGYWDRIPGRVRLTVLYQNFIHRPEGNNGKTPVEAAGVIVAGLDRFKTLIQQAALAAT